MKHEEEKNMNTSTGSAITSDYVWRNINAVGESDEQWCSTATRASGVDKQKKKQEKRADKEK